MGPSVLPLRTSCPLAMFSLTRSVIAAASAIVAFPGVSALVARPGASSPDNAAAPIAAVPSYSEPSLSPDGSEIAFVSAGDIWTVSARGGEARLLVSDAADESRPLFSPDGKRLAFVSTRTGGGDIYVLTLSTGETQRITYDDAPNQLDSWSRDGAWLYFSSTRNDISGMSDEFRVHSDGGTPMPVAADRYANEFWGAPSPDGSTLAITARGVSRGQWWRKGHSHLDESEIDLVRDVNGIPTYTPIVAESAKNQWPMWAPDAGTLYFVSDRSGAANLWAQAPTAGATPRQLTNFSDDRIIWPSIAADGDAIAFERHFGIWRYDTRSRQVAQVPITLRGSAAAAVPQHLTLTNAIQQFALSPDGRKIAFLVHGEVFATSAKDGGAAIRVTHTVGAEDQIHWAPDSRRIVYTSDRDGPRHLFTYDFTTGAETQLTRGATSDVSPSWSPDGGHIVYNRDAHELRVIDVAGNTDRLLTTASLGRPPFLGRSEVVFSPDSRWVAFMPDAGERNFGNVQVVSLAGGASRPVTFLANTNANSLDWSPDGTFLLVTSGQRTEDNQFARVDLIPRTPHFREDQFRDLFREQTPRSPSQSPARQPATRPDTTDTNSTNSVRALLADSQRVRGTSARGSEKPVGIVFDDIRNRLSLLPVPLNIGDVSISPDGKSALLTATAAGQTNLYDYSLDDASDTPPVPRQLTSTAGGKRDAQWSPDGKQVFYLEGGRLNDVTVDTRAVRPVNVSAEMDVDFAQEKMEVLDEAWSYLRDNFFNPTMNGVDWNAVHAEYTGLIEGAQTPDQMRRILSLLVGELNSSHSGIGTQARTPTFAGRLGLSFDRGEYERDGVFHVTGVVPLSPAAVAGVHAGEYLRSVNGEALTAHSSLQQMLAYTIGRRTVLGIATSPTGEARVVAVLPVNTTTEKGLLYRAWVAQRRAYVDSVSHGRLGYVHMYDMSENALSQLYLDLDAQNMQREGVVVDVRNNNGGFVNVYAIDVLSRRPYLQMTSRDRPAAPGRTELGQRALERPTVLVTNQHTLSDGEDFTQGYRTLGLGKVVGEPTAGWIIFTSSATLIDGTTVRLPSTRITTLSGADMELHPRPVDVPVTRAMGESYQGRDTQLDAAVATLLAQLDAKR